MITDLHVWRLFIALGALGAATAPLLKPLLS